MVFEEEDSDVGGDNEGDLDLDEHVNLDDVSDNDSDVSNDDLPSGDQPKSSKRKAPRSSEEPHTDSRKTKKKKSSHSGDGGIIDANSVTGTDEQECVDESVRGMSLYGYCKFLAVGIFE